MPCLRQGWILSLEPERFENRLASGRHDPEVGIGSRHTLKRLAVSILLDRSVLLSSKPICQRRMKIGSSAILVQLRVPFGQQAKRAVRMEGCELVTEGSQRVHTSGA